MEQTCPKISSIDHSLCRKPPELKLTLLNSLQVLCQSHLKDNSCDPMKAAALKKASQIPNLNERAEKIQTVHKTFLSCSAQDICAGFESKGTLQCDQYVKDGFTKGIISFLMFPVSVSQLIAEALRQDRICFENKGQEKQKLIALYNFNIIESLKEHRIQDDLSEKIVRDWPCSEIRAFLVRKQRKYEENLSTLVTKKQIVLSRDKSPLQVLMVNLNKKVIEMTRCLNKEEKERIYCELAGEIVAGLGAGVAIKKIAAKALETSPTIPSVVELDDKLSSIKTSSPRTLSVESNVRSSASPSNTNLQQKPTPPPTPTPVSHPLKTAAPKALPTSPDRVGYQGFEKEQALLNNLKDLPIEREIARRREVQNITTSTQLRWNRFSSASLISIHRELMRTNPSYRDTFKKVDHNNPNNFQHKEFKKQLEKAKGNEAEKLELIDSQISLEIIETLREVGLKPENFVKPVSSSPASIAFERLYDRSPEFKTWYLSQRDLPPLKEDLKSSSSEDPFTRHTKAALKKWDREIEKRLKQRSPIGAVVGFQMTHPQIEAVGRIAYFGEKKFVSTNDNRYWISTDSAAPEVIPRWSGKNQSKQEFLDEQAKLTNATYQTEVLKRYPQPKTDIDGFEIPIPNPNKIPGYNNGTIYKDGQSRLMTDVGFAQPMVQNFIMNGGWGYHVLPVDRLGKIVDTGWLEKAPSSKLSTLVGCSTLHMTTLIGGYSLKDCGGPSVSALVRTPLSPFRHKYAAQDTPDIDKSVGDQLFFGHVLSDPISAENVIHTMEFSVDGGLTWFPMTKDFVTLAEQGKIPNMRTQVLPKNR
ncbi:MAG: hypothetical protein JNL11_06165 [Bdellovibrionaceae bacterium]|nr:hypothetical protein [Pseudobdellovibrionaceae bacterium]